ncbi:hypothetical protein TCDM_12307 [Trypanosoma cruzi Dm28c]|uniref:Mucin TcMUCII n=1 Tax=Trypanosoma cruzi Dm28c TaxID=1416333 RepID=V5AUV0_TRYCR|nr:hypothetical protein TCDM_12307 [Trypanosoma cruzi Dm28c]
MTPATPLRVMMTAMMTVRRRVGSCAIVLLLLLPVCVATPAEGGHKKGGMQALCVCVCADAIQQCHNKHAATR